MSKSGDGADRTIFSTKSLKTFDKNWNNHIVFWDVCQNIVFQFFNWFYSFSWAETVCWNQYKMFLLCRILWKQLKKTVEKMILYYCGETMMATHCDHIVTMMKRRWGWCWTRRWTRVWARRSRRRWSSLNRKPWCHCPPTVITSSPRGRGEGVRCLCGRGVWWQAFGFDFRLITTIGTIFILVLVNTTVK